MTSTAAELPSEHRRGRFSDEQLAARVATGDSTAFEELYGRYREPLLGCLRSTLREPEDARDALQITMLNAFRALRESRVPEAVRPWLFTIARNAALSMARRRVVHVEIAEDDVPVLDGPAEAVVERERVDHVLGDLEAMPPRRRQVVLMRAVQGLDYEEIGGELGISSAAARQAAREARVALDQTARGRDLRCEDVSTALELGDTRNARSRAFLAHLRACTSCRRRLPAGSITRGQVAAILAGMLAIRTAASKALSLPAAAIDSIGGASVTAKAASIAAVALTAGSGIVAGVHGDTGPTPGPEPAPARGGAVAPLAAAKAPTKAPVSVAPEPRAGEYPPEPRPDDRPASVAADTEPAVAPSQGEAVGAAFPAPDGEDQEAPIAAPAPVEAYDARPEPTAKRDQEAGESPGARGSAPDRDGTPPGQGGTPPRQSGGSAGPSGSAPGNGGTPPGQGGTPPGQGGTPPGQGGTPPGQGGTPPGQGATPPGQGATPPGQGATPPGQGATPPGQTVTPPGQSGQTVIGDAPGASTTAPGQAGAGEPASGGNGNGNGAARKTRR